METNGKLHAYIRFTYGKNAPGIDAKGVSVGPNVGTTIWRRKISFVSAGNRTMTSKLTTSNLLTMSLYQLSYSGSYLTAKEKASEIRDSRCSNSEGNCPVDMRPSSLEHVITRLQGVLSKKVVILKQKISPYLVSDLLTTFLQWMFRVLLYHTILVTVSVKEDRNFVRDIERRKAKWFDSHLPYELSSRIGY
jgi:hypothetical protein